MASHEQSEVTILTRVKGDTDQCVHTEASMDILSSTGRIGHDDAEQAKTREISFIGTLSIVCLK